MLIVQNLVKKNYFSKFKMAAMPIYGKNVQTTSSPENFCANCGVKLEKYNAKFRIHEPFKLES